MSSLLSANKMRNASFATTSALQCMHVNLLFENKRASHDTISAVVFAELALNACVEKVETFAV